MLFQQSKGSHWKGPLIQKPMDLGQTVGGTNSLAVFTAIRANASIEGNLKVVGTLTTSGAAAFGFVGGAVQRFSQGTYFGTGGATAPITSTGLTSIKRVIMTRTRTNYNTATTNSNLFPNPCSAAGTLGSFYPVVFKINNVQALGASAAATWQWLAIGT